MPPVYGVERYRQHYFLADFDNLKQRFEEAHDETEAKRKAALGQGQHADEENSVALRNKEYRDFIPAGVALRIREFITFTVKLDGRAPDLKLTEDDETQLQQREASGDYYKDDVDNEVAVLKEYEIQVKEAIIKRAIERKYKISFAKGWQLAFENLVLLVLMVSVVMKANIFSLIYLLFIVRYLTSKSKTDLLVHAVALISLCFVSQYLLYLLNLTYTISPAPFPRQFANYPRNKDPKDMSIKYQIPLFFRSEVFRDLKLSYLIGIGIEVEQVENLILDFFNLYLVSMYIMHFRNPLLEKSMKKVFWRFPTEEDGPEKWDRLEPHTKKQVQWMEQGQSIDSEAYKDHFERLSAGRNSKQAVRYARELFQFQEMVNQSKLDLNARLEEYADLKHRDELARLQEDERAKRIRRIKNDLKNQNLYFRIVKQGSILVYMIFHIVTITTILFMAVMRRSLLSIGYVLILLRHLRDAADVLKQRMLAADNEEKSMVDRIDFLRNWIEWYHNPSLRGDLVADDFTADLLQ